MHFMIALELFTPFDTFSFQCYLRNSFEMSNKLNKIWLKGLNSRISKDGRLNWFKVSKRD